MHGMPTMHTTDLLVVDPDLPDTHLVVEVKQGTIDRERVARQIATYMVGRNCPVGLLVTPQETRLFQDSYEGGGADAIQEIGAYPTHVLLGLPEVPRDEDALIATVERWLEGLVSGSAGDLREDVRGVVSRYLLPAVTEGRIVSGILG